MRLLLVVTERLAVAGRHVALSPPLPAAGIRSGRFDVELRRPDRAVTHATAHASVPRVVPMPAEPCAIVAVLDVEIEDVPVGTEVWADAPRLPRATLGKH